MIDIPTNNQLTNRMPIILDGQGEQLTPRRDRLPQEANAGVGTTSYEEIVVKSLSFKRILQHFAALSGQKQSHLTILLQLLKQFKPDMSYDSLPNTGEELMKIDGLDFSKQGNCVVTRSVFCNNNEYL